MRKSALERSTLPLESDSSTCAALRGLVSNSRGLVVFAQQGTFFALVYFLMDSMIFRKLCKLF